MDLVLFILVIVNIYVVVFYRLMAQHYDDLAAGSIDAPGLPRHGTTGRKMLRTLSDIFTLPRYARLPEEGRRYARRFYIAVAVLFVLLGGLVAVFEW